MPENVCRSRVATTLASLPLFFIRKDLDGRPGGSVATVLYAHVLVRLRIR